MIAAKAMRGGPVADLKGKIVLVTGGAGAIGAAICAAIRAAGGSVIASDLKEGPGIDHALDVTGEAGWQEVMAKVEATHGRLDGLVNAAGFATFRRVVAVNLDGTFLGCKYAFPLLRKNGGSIVNMSSVLGLIGGPNLTAYTASKGGVSLLTKSVALYGARFKPPVRANALCPAFIAGPMVDEIAGGTKNPDAVKQKLALDIPLGRLGEPEEVASAAVYLLSDAAAFITGADVPVDGGLTAR